jgi:hypothetical protein
MSAEGIHHRNHILIVQPHGTGWTVEIKPEGVNFTSAEYPKTALSPDRDTVITQAKKIVDDLVSARFDKGSA